MSLNPFITIGQIRLFFAKKTYIKPLCKLGTMESLGLKMKRVASDVVQLNHTKAASIVKSFYDDLINKGLKQFNNPKLREAFIMKAEQSNISLNELSKIIDEVDPQAFINLTDPRKTAFTFKGVKIARPLDFEEAQLILKSNYTPDEISRFVRLRESVVGTSKMSIEDADLIIKNALDNKTSKRYLTLRQNKDFEFSSSEALRATYLKDADVPKFHNIMREQGLNADEALASVLNDLSESQNKTIQHIIQKYQINVYEAGLCAKLELEEKEIAKFLELKNKKITYLNDSNNKILEYTLTPEDAILCAKYDFTEPQLQRFAQLKNEYYVKKSVRNSGAETKYAIEDIIIWVKTGTSDMDILKYNAIINGATDPHFIFLLNNHIPTPQAKTPLSTLMSKIPDELKLKLKSSDKHIKECMKAPKQITTTTPKNNFKFPKSKVEWHPICTGEKKEIHEIFDSLQAYFNRGEIRVIPNLHSEDISLIHKLGTNKNNLYKDILRLDENNNLILTHGKDSFKVAIQRGKINEETAYLIKDLEHEAYYVAHKGAVSKLESYANYDFDALRRSLLPYCEYSALTEEKIYAHAAEQFPIKIIDKNSKCIIGQGIPEFGIPEFEVLLKKNDEDYIKHFQKVLQTLKDKNELTVQNILRVMPQFSAIQINPYTTSKNGKMLYSISAEWKSKEGIKWQLRTHSTDLEHFMNSATDAENSDWIFRLGHEVNGETKYFEFDEAKGIYTDTGNFTGRSSHIQIPHSPFEKDNLLGNIHFQNIMRQISSKS